MITVRRAGERHEERSRNQQVRFTFDVQNRADPLADGFGALEGLDEDRLAPGAALRHRARPDAEVITYVYRGGLACYGAVGHSGLIQAGEFQRTAPGGTGRDREKNASRTDWSHVFRLWLGPCQAVLEPALTQKRFSTADRRGALCLVASPDGRRGSLLLHQDALLYSALLGPGKHIVHELQDGRSAWLHLVDGEIALAGVVLSTGDGVGLTAERTVSLTAREQTEILLVDLPRRPS